VDAVVLSNGRVLIAGGTTADGTATRATALFDPTGNSWSAGPPLTTARRLHTTTLLGDGRVLVAGGLGADKAELYDPAANAWSEVPGTIRSGHTATLLPGGRVLVAGGTGPHGGALVTAELFDPAARTWSPAAPMLDARAGHRAVPLDATRTLIAGGALPTGDGGSAALAYCEVYDAAHGTWTATGSLGTPRQGHEATPLGGGRVLVSGGDAVTSPDGTYDPHSLATTEIYDLATGVWSAASPMPGGRSAHRGLRTRAGTVLVLGGRGDFRSVAAYDAAADRWITRAGMLTGRSAFAVTELADTRVLVAGGTGAEALIP
jgi:hypothetical protein